MQDGYWTEFIRILVSLLRNYYFLRVIEIRIF